MVNHLKQSEARPLFRWLAGLASLVMAMIAVPLAFPGVVGSDGKPNYPLAWIMLLGVLGGAITATGRWKSSRSKQMGSLLAAKK
jgi:hypothetical protein